MNDLGKIKKLEDIKGHMTREQLSQHNDIEKSLHNYPKLEIDPPKGMKGEALEEWHRIVPLLVKNTPASELDHALIEIYCTTYAQYRLCQREVSHDGVVITTSTGMKKRNPYLTQQNEAVKQIKMVANELGLSVNARTRLEFNKTKEDTPTDPFKAVLNGG